MKNFVEKIGITALFALALFVFSIHQASADNAEVDCNDGDSLQEALDGAENGDTIEVSGVCNEAIVITKDRIQLIGLAGASINSPSGTAINVFGRQAVITGFSIPSAGSTGIGITKGGTATIENNTITNPARHGIRVAFSSNADIISNTVEDAGSFGIIISFNGAAKVINNTISRSTNAGILVDNASAADVDGNVIDGDIDPSPNITPSGVGLRVRNGGSVRLSGATGFRVANQFNNNNTGIQCNGHSSIQTREPQTFSNNTTDTNINLAECKLVGDPLP